MSLKIHPALLIKNAPIKKVKYHFSKFSLSFEINANANQQGHISNIKPIGLENLIKFKKYFNFKGDILSNMR